MGKLITLLISFLFGFSLLVSTILLIMLAFRAI